MRILDRNSTSQEMMYTDDDGDDSDDGCDRWLLIGKKKKRLLHQKGKRKKKKNRFQSVRNEATTGGVGGVRGGAYGVVKRHTYTHDSRSRLAYLAGLLAV